MIACYLKRVFVLLLLCCTQTFAQNKSIPIGDALKKVTNTFKTQFVYNRQLIEGKSTNYNLDNMSNKTVEEVLKGILYPNNLVFLYIKDNYYTIVAKEDLSKSVVNESRLTAASETQIILEDGVNNKGRMVAGRNMLVTGIVKDDEGSPLSNVSVILKNSSKGTTTNSSGNFSIDASSSDVLVFSKIGYEPREIEIGKQVALTVTLELKPNNLNDVVVIGYGTQKKSDLTGAVASVGSRELNAYPTSDAVQALQGRAAGVSVQSVNGAPGQDFKIRVRGSTSINASSDPLMVVDGMVGGTMPSPQDIASIEVLKDASSTAIYGSRGANGVVIITTRTGKSGKTILNINSSYSMQSEIGRLSLLNARDFAAYINEARNSNFYNLDSIKINTDWSSLIFNPGYIQNHQLSISGGSDKIKYYVSGIFFDQKGIIKKSGYDKFSITSNLKYDVNDNIHLSLSSIIQNERRKIVPTQTGGGATNEGVIAAAQRFDPNLGIVDNNGIYTTSKVGIAAFANPMSVIDGRDEETKQDNIQSNFRAVFDISKKLLFNSNFGIKTENGYDGSYSGRISDIGLNNNGLGSLSYARNFNFLTEQYFNYNNNNIKNSIVAVAGYSYQKFKNEGFSASSAGFISDALGYWNLGVGTTLQPPNSSYSESKIASFYSRVNYSFDRRYLFTLTGRYDGASQFSEGQKWSFFPSGAFSWNISNEKFYPQNNFISVLKLRTSYGLTGNQAIGPYESLSRLSSSFFVLNNASVSSVRPSTIANMDLTWETTAQLDLGLDLKLFNGRIDLTGDYYNKRTNGLLFRVPIAAFSGYENRLENLGEIENSGFELDISSRNIINKVRWSTSLNLTLNKNKVVSLPNNSADIIYATAPSFTGAVDNSILRAGEPVGSFYGYVYKGVYQSGDKFIPGGSFETAAGGEKFADLNNDGVLDSKDRAIIGDPNPKAIWGLNNDIAYKGFSLNIFFQASTGGDILNLTKMELDRLSGNSNATTDALNRWSLQNTNTNVPRAYAGRVTKTSSRFVEDGSYARLKNISLGYEISPDVFRKYKLSSIRIYVSGQNILTFTNYSGVDPEVAYRSSNTNLGLDFGSYPNTISYTLGLNIAF